jgi:hypothetical protein
MLSFKTELPTILACAHSCFSGYRLAFPQHQTDASSGKGDLPAFAAPIFHIFLLSSQGATTLYPRPSFAEFQKSMLCVQTSVSRVLAPHGGVLTLQVTLCPSFTGGSVSLGSTSKVIVGRDRLTSTLGLINPPGHRILSGGLRRWKWPPDPQGYQYSLVYQNRPSGPPFFQNPAILCIHKWNTDKRRWDDIVNMQVTGVSLMLTLRRCRRKADLKTSRSETSPPRFEIRRSQVSLRHERKIAGMISFPETANETHLALVWMISPKGILYKPVYASHSTAFSSQEDMILIPLWLHNPLAGMHSLPLKRFILHSWLKLNHYGSLFPYLMSRLDSSISHDGHQS